MKAIILTAPGKFSLQTVPVPVPQAGEVLVKIEASPINPSDGAFILGLYSTNKPYPTVPGFEGSGTVMSSGGGLLAWRLIGRKVALASSDHYPGLWAEYAVVSAKNCIPLPNHIPFTLGCCFFVNPLTVLMFMEKIKENKHKAVIQTAACSSLGKMFLRLCIQEKVPIINIVRRDEQISVLQEIGAEYVLNSTSENFDSELKELSKKLGANVAFECVSGDITGRVMNAMPDGSVVYLYGAMSMGPAEGINPGSVIFANKSLRGLWLTTWLANQGLFKLYRLMNKVVEMLPGILRSDVSREFSLEEVTEALEFYQKNMSAGKVLIRPSLNN